jgi:hypothetical protein
MKHCTRAAVLALGLGLAGAGWAAGETEGTWDKVKSFSHAQKNEAVAAGKKLIAETDKKIAELGQQTKNATAETKAAHEANMKELKEKKAAAEAELAKLGKASGEVWDATKTGFSDAGKALSAAYDKAAAAVKK